MDIASDMKSGSSIFTAVSDNFHSGLSKSARNPLGMMYLEYKLGDLAWSYGGSDYFDLF
jgi:hypothetical protein